MGNCCGSGDQTDNQTDDQIKTALIKIQSVEDRESPEKSEMHEKPKIPEMHEMSIEGSDRTSQIRQGHEPLKSIATLVEDMNDLETELPAFLYDKYAKAEDAGLPVIGPLKYSNGATYRGQYKDGLRHGKGVQIKADGSCYDGFWVKDKRSGQGRQLYKGGDVYTGEWKDDKSEGNGKFVHCDGTTYVGEWNNNKIHGEGIFTWPDGRKYVGEYRDQLKHGYGEFYFTDGTVYKGMWEKGLPLGDKCIIQKSGI